MKNQSRNLLLLLIDVVLINLAIYFCLLLRFDAEIPVECMESYIHLIPVFTIVNMLFFIKEKLYSRIWEYASIREMLAIIKATTCSMAVSIIIIYLLSLPGMPRSTYIAAWIMITIFIGFSRISWRIFRDYCLQKENTAAKKIIIIGAGDAGAILAREIRSNPQLNMRVLAFIDDDQSKQKKMLGGIPVMGRRKKIPVLVKNLEIAEIIIAMPSAPGDTVREIVDICKQTLARVKILPGIYPGSTELLKNIRDVQMEDLLRRAPVQTDLQQIAGYIGDKIVMISGAGGSIGSELCRQVIDLSPTKMLMLDCCENNLFDIEMELREKYSEEILCPELIDIKNQDKLEDIFMRYRPQVVFHAAAYKHVPMMERHPEEAVNNNVIGTHNMARLADHYGVETFILVSTDKAVNPTSVMGASKRIAELIIKDINRSSETSFAAVRFGNVLGSRGSVIPTFMKQIEKGGPLTVTHPEMKRYFMTIPEAVQLIIQAGAMATGGEIFVLDMGAQIKIADLARDLIRISGYEPDKDIEIIYTGIRPGEKLYEELFTDREGMASTRHERIFISNKELDHHYINLSKSINKLSKKNIRERSEILKLIMSVVPEYQGKGEMVAEQKAVND